MQIYANYGIYANFEIVCKKKPGNFMLFHFACCLRGVQVEVAQSP